MPTTDLLSSETPKLNRKDFIPPVDVRWCPGCGDYAILNSIQKVFPELGIPRENFVIVSGIGCSSRFPYYMNTYGFHSIHGRAPTVATGIKVANPDLSVWMVTGDGDGLSIGGNHLMHLLRRNIDINILLFNNKIYGLTKGQYSPTSELGKVTKSSPMGSPDKPINPLSFALAAEATFVARTVDTNPKHMQQTFDAAAKHKGVSFVEILQNCVIFYNQAWEGVSGRQVRDDRLIQLEQNKPLLFGKEKNKGIRISGAKPRIVTLGENGITEKDIWVHDEKCEDPTYAYLLSQLQFPDYPLPMGVIRSLSGRPTYESTIIQQRKTAIQNLGKGNLWNLLKGKDYWEVKEGQEGKTQAKSVNRSASKNSEEQQIMAEQKREARKLSSDPMLAVLKRPLEDALREFGSGELIKLSPTDPIGKAVDLFKEHKIGAIPVFDQEKLVGILTERDILMKVVLKSIDRDHAPVESFMTSHPNFLKGSDSIALAINKLSTGGYRHLPIEVAKNEFALISVKGLLTFIKTHALG